MKRVFICITFVFLYAPLVVEGMDSTSVVINEIAWMGTKVEAVDPKNWWRYEWIELYNPSQQEISLNGWKLELSRETLDWSLDLKDILTPQGYFLIVASEKIAPQYDINYANLGGKFNNKGQNVVLKNSSGQVVDHIDAFLTGKWFAGNNETKQTMERVNPLLSANDLSNWIDSTNPGGTPRSKNSAITTVLPSQNSLSITPRAEPSYTPFSATPFTIQYSPLPTPSLATGIVFNEILPSPKGKDEQEEWVELFNQNETPIDITGWQMKDTIGITTSYTFPKNTIIATKGYLVFTRPITKIALNNSGDKLILLRPNGNVVDSIAFDKAPLGQSYDRFTDGWVWSTTLTPGAKNAHSPMQSLQQDPQNEKSKQNASIQDSFTEDTSAPLENLASVGKGKMQSWSFLKVVSLGGGIAILCGAVLVALKKRLTKNQSF